MNDNDMTISKALDEGSAVCIRLLRVNDEREPQRQVFLFFENPKDKLAKLMSDFVGPLDYVGEPTEQLPFSYAKTVCCFCSEDVHDGIADDVSEGRGAAA